MERNQVSPAQIREQEKEQSLTDVTKTGKVDFKEQYPTYIVKMSYDRQILGFSSSKVRGQN